MQFLTDKDLADRYHVHRCTVWRWTTKHNFPQPIRLSGGVSRWKLADVEAHEEKQAEQVA